MKRARAGKIAVSSRGFAPEFIFRRHRHRNHYYYVRYNYWITIRKKWCQKFDILSVIKLILMILIEMNFMVQVRDHLSWIVFVT